MSEEKELMKGEPSSADQNVKQLKKVVTTLDDLPAGSPEDYEKEIDRKTLPDGVESKMLYKDILTICLPSLAELTLVQLASMVDLMMVGKLGPWAITAVGLTTQPKFLLSTAFISLNVGTMAMVGRYRGAGNRDKANLILRQAIMLNASLGVFFAIVGVIFAEPLVAFMGAQEEQVLIGGTQYLRVQMFGLFTMSITSAITNTLKGSGDSKSSMIYNMTGNVVNVFANYALIYGNWGFPRLEVLGASIATVFGQFISMLMAIFVITRPDRYIRLYFPKGSIKPDKESLTNITRIGIPSAVEQIAMRIGVIIFSKTIAGLGTIAYATHQVCMNIQSLTFMNGQAFATSATSLVSQSLGKNRPDMAMHYSKRTQNAATACAIGIAIFVFTCNEFLIGLYNDDPQIIAMGHSLLQMVALIQPLQSAQFVLAGALRGAGDTKYTAKVTMLTAMIARPVLAIVFIKYFDLGLKGAWYALCIDQLARTLLVVLRYRTGKWVRSFKPHTESATAE